MSEILHYMLYPFWKVWYGSLIQYSNYYFNDEYAVMRHRTTLKYKEKFHGELAELFCSKCGYQIERVHGILAVWFAGGKLEHFKCPSKKVVTKDYLYVALEER